MKRVVSPLAVLLVARSLHAYLCSRGPKPAVEEVLRRSEAAFEGTVIGRRMVLAHEDGVYFPAPEYEFRVSRGWGRVRHRPPCGSSVSLATVRIGFRRTGSYLVFAGRHCDRHDRLSTSKCSSTMPAAKANAYFAALGKPEVTFVSVHERRTAAV
jgi:hypothetical protein